jgi:hypothetical protein
MDYLTFFSFSLSAAMKNPAGVFNGTSEYSSNFAR